MSKKILGWVPVDKSIIEHLKPVSKEGQYSEWSAYLSLRIDLDNDKVKGFREYGRIWNWSRGKVDKFFKKIGYKTDLKKEDILRTLGGHTKGHPCIIIFNDLGNEERTPKRTIRGHLEDTTINTNTNTKDKDKKIMGKKFQKPTPEEVESYGLSINYKIDGVYFCAFYESKGWMIGKNKMKSWKSSVVTWKKNNPENIINKKPELVL